MFMRLSKSRIRATRLFARSAQSTLEYAIIITVTVAAMTAMSVYVKRAIQANLRILEKQVNNEPK